MSPGAALKALAGLSSLLVHSIFGEAGRSVCLGHGSRTTVWGLENLNSRNNLCNSCVIGGGGGEEERGCPVSHPPPQVSLFTLALLFPSST